MEYIVWLVMNLLFAGVLTSGKVEENRGLIIDKPNWKHVPERTIDIIFFFVVACALAMIKQEKEIWIRAFGEVVVFFMLFYIERCLLWKQCQNGWFIRVLKHIELGKEKIVCESGEKEDDQVNGGISQDAEKRIKILEEIAFYMNSTTVYMVKFLLLFMLIEAGVFSVATKNIVVLSDMEWVANIQNQAQLIDWHSWGVYLCIAGMMLSIYRIASLLLPPEEKVSYNSYNRIKHNLEKGMVKN